MQYQSEHLRKRPRGLKILEIESLGLSRVSRWMKPGAQCHVCRTLLADHLMYVSTSAIKLILNGQDVPEDVSTVPVCIVQVKCSISEAL